MNEAKVDRLHWYRQAGTQIEFCVLVDAQKCEVTAVDPMHALHLASMLMQMAEYALREKERARSV